MPFLLSTPPPRSGSTRRLYEKKLASLLSDGLPDGPAVSPQRPMTNDDGAVRRRLGGGADGEGHDRDGKVMGWCNADL